MVHHPFWEPNRPTFPERQDLPALTDSAAEAALATLRYLVARDAVDVYSRPVRGAAGQLRWNIWISEEVIVGGVRLELQEWAERHAARCGGDAA
jgi:hypothetical protein